MGQFFNHDLAALEHPQIHYDRRGRPSAKLERKVVEEATRPLIDAIQRIVRRGVKPALSETEYVFFNYSLKTDNGAIREKYLDVTLVHDGPDQGIAGPIAQVSLIQPGVMRWVRDYKDTLVYTEIAENPEEFRHAFESAIRFIFGFCQEIL